jgi:hypothetical protein
MRLLFEGTEKYGEHFNPLRIHQHRRFLNFPYSN